MASPTDFENPAGLENLIALVYTKKTENTKKSRKCNLINYCTKSAQLIGPKFCVVFNVFKVFFT